VLDSLYESEERDVETKGRKHKFSVADKFRIIDDRPATAEVQGRIGTVVAQGPGKAEYTVKFDDDPNTVTYVQSNWMKPIEQAKPVSAA
jgi:hypothetical protein